MKNNCFWHKKKFLIFLAQVTSKWISESCFTPFLSPLCKNLGCVLFFYSSFFASGIPDRLYLFIGTALSILFYVFDCTFMSTRPLVGLLVYQRQSMYLNDVLIIKCIDSSQLIRSTSRLIQFIMIWNRLNWNKSDKSKEFQQSTRS